MKSGRAATITAWVLQVLDADCAQRLGVVDLTVR
jgi:hypothetical protein